MMEESKFPQSLEDVLLYRRVVEWDESKLVLDDGTTVSIEETDYDCCASAGGSWSAVELDAVITDVVRGEEEPWDDGDTYGTAVTVKLYHNQNPIAQADLDANAGNGGYYYSVASFVVRTIDGEEIDFYGVSS